MTKKVIIIDDSLTSLNLIKTAFAGSDWEVYCAQNAKSALDMIYDVAPDIIVTDAIMPVMGGFQLLKLIRSNPKTSKIPVIVYSVLDEKNSKFYIKKERAEYYLKKSETLDELLTLANNVIKEHPIDDDYKYEILKTSSKFDNFIQSYAEPTEIPTAPPLKFEELEAKFKEKYDFTRSDDKILSEIFSIIYPILEYNLAVVSVESFEKKEKTAYFDIRDIILSPIFQNHVLNSLETKNSFLFKKYAPNLKVITNEEEFFTKIRFDFEYKENNVATVIFYSKDKSKWMDNNYLDVIKNVLDNFFKARYINKSSRVHKTNELSNKYFIDKFDFKFDSQTKREMYTAIIDITNLKDLQDNLSSEEMDFLNSKISEKLISFVSDDERVYKNDEGGYNLVIFAKDEAHANQKLGWVIDILDEINIENNKVDINIGASNCKIDNQFNFYEAQKCAHVALDSANSQDRVVIYGSK
ncbi:MAG: response regulator [Candidatus Gastranaerophilales bacterium]|nr:response regulator [Candidatus Gastranaerophilales bacterium]